MPRRVRPTWSGSVAADATGVISRHAAIRDDREPRRSWSSPAPGLTPVLVSLGEGCCWVSEGRPTSLDGGQLLGVGAKRGPFVRLALVGTPGGDGTGVVSGKRLEGLVDIGGDLKL